ncbi:response regulator [Paenibacillus sp. MBLB4367]|uniref:response regulator n=1 Tax=Paenibacillus sp. MBLB4367 TaxID=3384767 RepID=UPI0039082076
MKLSLRIRVMVVLLLLTSVCLMLVGTLNYRAAKQHVLDSLTSNAASTLGSHAYELSAWIETRLAELKVMSRTDLIRFGKPDDQMLYLENEQARADFVRTYGIVDTTGRMPLTSGNTLNIRDDILFKEAMNGKEAVAEQPLYSTDDPTQIVLKLIVPIFNANNKVSGALTEAMFADKAFRKYFDIRLGSTSTAYMIHKDGTVLYHPDSSQILKVNMLNVSSSLKEALQNAIQTGQGLRKTEQGEKLIVFASPVPDTNWFIVIDTKLSEFQKPLQSLLRKTLITVGAAELVMAVLLLIVLNPIVSRIERLVRVTEAVAGGNLNVKPVAVEKDDEIGTLARSVNGMVEHLRTLFERLEAIINQNDYAIVCTDASWTVTYFNKTAERLLGYKAEEVNHIKKIPFYHDMEELAEAAAELAARLGYEVDADSYFEQYAASERLSIDFERTYVHKNGTRIPVMVNSTKIIDADGNITGYVNIFRDITALKETQEELVMAKKEAEEATQAKSRFVARMSHEIRTPLNGIIGLSQLMLKTDMTSVQEDYQKKIIESSQSLLRIVNDILDFSKVEAGKLALEKVRFQLDDVFRKCADTLSVTLGKQQLEVVVDTPEQLPDALLGDPLRLEQILLNLCGNAIKFTEKGFVIIKAQVLEEQEEAVTIRFMVIDSGIGLSEEQISLLFQPFTQADGSTSRKYGGTGLGLVISKSFIEMMGGTLEVYSKKGVGSQFSFTLTFQLPANAKLRSFKLPGPPAIRRALVVEDSDLMRSKLRSMLQSLSFQVTSVESWKRALELLQRPDAADVYDIVILDMETPDMYGADTWIAMNEAAVRARAATLAMTSAYGREELLGMEAANRPDAFIVKPVSRLGLFQTIAALLDRKREKHLQAASPDIHETAATGESAGTVLLAEDNPINQQVAVELLRSRGFTVTVAGTGREALEKLGLASWDIVLMDIHMPEMDGCDAVKVIRADHAYDRLPIVAMTANIMKEDHAEYYRIGFNDVITKPIDVGVMFEVIAKWLHPGEAVSRQLDHPEPPERTLPLPQLAGIRLELALQRLDGRIGIFKRMAATFGKEYDDFMPRLREALQQGDRKLAGRLAHTLKGAAGNLAAERLYAAAELLEADIRRNNEDTMAESDTLEAVEHALLEVLQTAKTLDIPERH